MCLEISKSCCTLISLYLNQYLNLYLNLYLNMYLNLYLNLYLNMYLNLYLNLYLNQEGRCVRSSTITELSINNTKTMETTNFKRVGQSFELSDL